MKGKTTEYLLQMKNIVKTFPGVRALDGVNLDVRPGSVHALMGENGAGKSTLMKCLFGIYNPDEGEIIFKGEKVRFLNPKQALDHGVSMVHQELNQVPETTVMENIWMGRMPKNGLIVDDAKMYQDTKEVFERLNLDIDPKEKIGRLSVSQRQMIEIAKAVSADAKIVVLDEPTSSLTEKEVDHLFRIINSLRDQGCGIVYISHKMEEILKISDDVTVMRDGQYVFSGSAKEMNTDQLITLIVGRELTNRFPEKKSRPSDEVLLKIEHLKGMYDPTVKDVTFQLRKGEILGIAGLMGSRRTETIETIFGIRTRADGTIEKDGKMVGNHNARESIDNGFALITEDRRQNGIFAGLDIEFNSTIANMKGYANKLGVINEKKMEEDTTWVIESMHVKTPSQKEKIGNLSGGNQQKVIMGRWLLIDSDIMMLDEPTRGIDVGAKYEIYQLVMDYAAKGKGVIFISSEMPELLGITDRIMVMSNGLVAGIVETKDTSQEDILRLSAKYL
ncbi:MAG: ATP-binding cassette domain-containing protein [Lachnospiraceae bacterium]|nr:ATP-binding cassette domain-containing protein [Lachnospiraceae bacterium]